MQQNSYGFRLRIETNIDLTGVTSPQLFVKIQKPDGTVLEKQLRVDTTAPLKTGAGDFQVEQGDLDQAGVYMLQAVDRTPPRQVWSSVIRYVVLPNVPVS